MDIVSYYETFIYSDRYLNKNEINQKLKDICKKYFKGVVKVKFINLPYGGWEIKAKGLRKQWVKAYIIDEGKTFKLYWHNSNEFLRWVSTIIIHELGIEYNSVVLSGRNFNAIKPENSCFNTFKEYMDNIELNGPRDALVKNTIPRIIRRKFDIK